MNLIDANITSLRQALILIEPMDEFTFTASPATLSPHRVGSHLRHILEFYESFLDGLEAAYIDYDRRKRDETIERDPAVAAMRIRSIIGRLQTAALNPEDTTVFVRMEDAPESDHSGRLLTSSIGRELQVLSSHTIHHFALIAVTMRSLGINVDPDFGTAPSTLRYRMAQRVAEAA